ncbi:hypothetical protein Vafri_17131 [Volvox africanus]|uniref:Uncharacterized protein n=1 Tax=Volvox africanus TaxID=51714 RepID=A0A8J4F6C1_9CHLO|nr:hypothetical protein Vafri_17131 [Volvox africanus]
MLRHVVVMPSFGSCYTAASEGYGTPPSSMPRPTNRLRTSAIMRGRSGRPNRAASGGSPAVEMDTASEGDTAGASAAGRGTGASSPGAMPRPIFPEGAPGLPSVEPHNPAADLPEVLTSIAFAASSPPNVAAPGAVPAILVDIGLSAAVNASASSAAAS